MKKFALHCALALVIPMIIGCAGAGTRGMGLVLDSTYLYSRPDSSSGHTAKVNRGEAVILKANPEKGAVDGWVNIALSDEETTGWIKKEYLHDGPKIAITLTEKTLLHVRPDDQSQTIKTLQSGTPLFVLQQKGNWKKVSVDYSLSGWINTAMYESGIR